MRPPIPVTERELDGLPRPARLRRMWWALSPAGRERVWALLTDENRVEVVAAVFNATVERDPWAGPETRAAVQARWESENDR